MTLTFNPQINRFLGLIVEHFCVKFADPRCVRFLIYRAEKETLENSGDPPPTTVVGVGNYASIEKYAYIS